MLTLNVLCLKKKKKRTYSLSSANNSRGYGAGTSKNERSRSGTVTMMQITEDTPPDMLAGAMDLTVHLPNGKAVKMAVERSTPMMDLLVQITTAHHLQLSNHTLQALGMAPSSEHSDKILPFKPNTPIGALDTQHIRVLPKGRTLPAPKYQAPGHQPFESTFRLKVHLPRNQLYVTRVSRNVLLEDIMKKVCEEKILDPLKYDFKHPGNLDQVLDPKLTLSHYQITEIYVVAKGTTNLNQAFSAADIMVLRKEEERKQMHTKTGGGVFNLIFKRGKSSMGSGSVSSDNRSISPTHSDESRSVTPPAVQASIVALPKTVPPPNRPKPPQRKRRPAPKPPQTQVAEATKEEDVEKNSLVVSGEDRSNQPNKKTSENGLTICHSRNSSDSSGYHEASILSDHCANTSLPRNRPKSAFVGDQTSAQSTSNLSSMSVHSRSTTSLMTGRKKKAAPPPPPVPVSPASSVVAQSEKPSPLVVASQTDTAHKELVLDTTLTPNINPIPKPRPRTKAPKVPVRSSRPKSEIVSSNVKQEAFSRISYNEESLTKIQEDAETKMGLVKDSSRELLNESIVNSVLIETLGGQFKGSRQDDHDNYNKEELFEGVELRHYKSRKTAMNSENPPSQISEPHSNEIQTDINEPKDSPSNNRKSEDVPLEDMLVSLEFVSPVIQDRESSRATPDVDKIEDENETHPSPKTTIINAQKSTIENIFKSEEFLKESKPPEVVGLIPKPPKEDKKHGTSIGTFGKKRGLQLSSTFLEHKRDPETESISSKRSGESKSSRNSVASGLNTLDDEISDLDENMFSGSLSKASTRKRPEVFNELFGMHEYGSQTDKNTLHRNVSVGSLHSVRSIPGLEGAKISKWNNTEDLNAVSLNSYGVRNRWVTGDASDTESITSSNLTPAQIPTDIIPSEPLESSTPVKNQSEEKSLESTDSGISQDRPSPQDSELEGCYTPPPPPILDDIQSDITLKTEPSNLIESKAAEPTDNLEEVVSSGSRNTVVVEELATPLETSKPVIEDSPMPSSQVLENKGKSDSSSTEILVKHAQSDTDLADIDWQYQLPSPPKAFRDSSPLLNEIESITDFKDSVVTSPELFEKLRSLEDTQSDKDTLKSEVTSIASEEPLNTLSLEHLEKRKSLVYNRELTTSLKMTDSLENTIRKSPSNFTSSVTTLNTAHADASESISNHKKTQRTKNNNQYNNTLPNFKITTYDVPKQNIKVFEDDTVRSNAQISSLTKKDIGRSMENISFGKYPEDSAREYNFYKPQTSTTNRADILSRSESFSVDYKVSKPVSRSKSTLTLNKPYVSRHIESNMSRSNSLFDVSGLQSLEVMRLIRNKLNTPTGSIENVTFREEQQKPTMPRSLPLQDKLRTSETPKITEPPVVEEKPQVVSPQPVKKYYYRGPPAVNMTTWSERPKIPVAVKEDEDYKLGNANTSSRLLGSTTNGNSNNGVEIRNNGFTKVNGYSREIESKNGQTSTNNVVIKIGDSNTFNNHFTKSLDNQRFIGPTGYRKPFSNLNRTSSVSNTQRPHSIAVSSDLDLSRVPVVRSIEFKKPYRDFNGTNTSITHINQENGDFRPIGHNSSLDDKFKIPEKQESESNKHTFRVSNLRPVENSSVPVVRGFKSTSDVNHRLSWNPPSTYNTLPAKPKAEKDFTTNQHVPFSQSTLKRTASSKLYSADQNCNDINKPVIKEERIDGEDNSFKSLPSSLVLHKVKTTSVPPPPPQLPKVSLKKVVYQDVKTQPNSLDTRSMLLDSIRNFGGKKGLRAVKA